MRVAVRCVSSHVENARGNESEGSYNVHGFSPHSTYGRFALAKLVSLLGETLPSVLNGGNKCVLGGAELLRLGAHQFHFFLDPGKLSVKGGEIWCLHLQVQQRLDLLTGGLRKCEHRLQTVYIRFQIDGKRYFKILRGCHYSFGCYLSLCIMIVAIIASPLSQSLRASFKFSALVSRSLERCSANSTTSL